MPRGKIGYEAQWMDDEYVETWRDSHGNQYIQATPREDLEGSSDSSEALSTSDAADIWMSNGMDEDYTFGYSEDELRNSL